MTAAIWSTKPNSCNLNFPALTLIRFMYNHHLLQITSRPAWLTIRNGAIQYINSVTSKCKHIYLNTPVTKVFRRGRKPTTRGEGGTAGTGEVVVVVVSNRGEEVFDHVIFATHAD